MEKQAGEKFEGDETKIKELKGKIYEVLFTVNNEINILKAKWNSRKTWRFSNKEVGEFLFIFKKRWKPKNCNEWEKLEVLGENMCVSPAVVAQKSDGSIKIALDATKLNKSFIRKRMQMPRLI